MDAILLCLALALQSADAGYTCRTLSHGGRELNPVLGQSCARVVAMKAGVLAIPIALPKGKLRTTFLVANVAAGGVGFGVSFTRNWK